MVGCLAAAAAAVSAVYSALSSWKSSEPSALFESHSDGSKVIVSFNLLKDAVDSSF